MSFLSVHNMCRTNMKFMSSWNVSNINKINFKKYKLKEISSHSIYVKNFFRTKSHYIYITDVFKKRLLNITQYCVENKRKDHFRSHHQKYVSKPMNDSFKKALCHKSLINSLLKCESVAEQIELFHSSIKLPDDDISSRHLICQELEKILKPYCTSCSICLVGSSINGFGLKGCDVDLSLQYLDSNFNQSSSDTVVSSLEEDTSDKKLPPPRLYNFPPKNQLLSIRKILQNLKFEEPLTVIPGRCPILNFCYQNLSCDLSINNSSAIQSTNLMLLCSELDDRVARLVQIIIYWAKQSKLIGGPSKFKSYAMFLLVIHFLQTRSPPLFPAVEIMFEKTDFWENRENWSYDVGKYISRFERSKNRQSVEDLLREFFFFYGNFDFSYIICPLNGCTVDRKAFGTKIDCHGNNFALNTISIQDPLNPAWNVTSEVNWRNCKSLLKALISVCENYQDSNCWSPGPNNWGLASLIYSEFSYQNFKAIKEFVINIPVASRTDESTEDNVEVLESAAYAIKQILKYGLLFPCYRVDSDTNFSSLGLSQKVKSAVQNEFLSSINDNSIKETNSNSDISYVCVTRDTWAGRNSFTSLTNNAENLLENEHMTSKKMDLERESTEKEAFYFLCQCYTKNFEQDVNLYIRFKPLNNNRFIPKLAIFLKEYIPKFMDSFLLNPQKEKENLLS